MTNTSPPSNPAACRTVRLPRSLVEQLLLRTALPWIRGIRTITTLSQLHAEAKAQLAARRSYGSFWRDLDPAQPALEIIGAVARELLSDGDSKLELLQEEPEQKGDEQKQVGSIDLLPRDSVRVAILKTLSRRQTDADFGHLLGPGTETFRLLCEAEAALTGKAVEEVTEERSKTAYCWPRRLLDAHEGGDLAAAADVGAQLCRMLSEHAGETGENEGAVETLKRILDGHRAVMQAKGER